MIAIQFLLTAIVVVIAPGFGVFSTLTQGLGQGRRAALWAALGCTFGILPHLAAAMLGLVAILHLSALLFAAVKWGGVGYLLFLAWQMLRGDGARRVSANRSAAHGWRIAARGALINILDPKLAIFFLALLPPFLSGNAATAMLEMSLLGGVFMATTFVVFLIYGMFASSACAWMRSTATVIRWLNRSFTAIFAVAGRLALERT